MNVFTSTPDQGRRGLRMALSLMLTVTGAAVTVATSPGDPGPFGFSEDNPIDVEIWESTVLLGAGETSAHVFLSFPTDLLETHEDEITFDFDVEVDGTGLTHAPTTQWEMFVGDATGLTTFFSTPMSSDVSEFGAWSHVGAFNSHPVSVREDCDGEGCIPCDLSSPRCDVVLTLSRDAISFPRMRMTMRGEMRQTDFGDPEPVDNATSRF